MCCRGIKATDTIYPAPEGIPLTVVEHLYGCLMQFTMQVYKKMCCRGIEPTDTTFTALISAYAKAERLEEALAAYKIMVRAQGNICCGVARGTECRMSCSHSVHRPQ